MGDTAASPAVRSHAIPDSLSVDRAHEALASAERRGLLAALDREDGEASLSTLARIVTRLTGGTGPEEGVRVRIRLYHVHVPKLADLGYVSFDQETDAVELTDRGGSLAALVEERGASHHALDE